MSTVIIYNAKEFENTVCSLSDIVGELNAPFVENIYIKTDDDEQEEIALGVEYANGDCFIRNGGKETSCNLFELTNYMYDIITV